MTKLLVLAGLCAALTAGAGPAQAADECDGLMVCVPVAGPWVVVPTAASFPRPQVEYQLTCPRGYIVGGTDARVRPFVPTQVDPLPRSPDRGEERLHERPFLTDEREDRAVVVRVRVDVE